MLGSGGNKLSNHCCSLKQFNNQKKKKISLSSDLMSFCISDLYLTRFLLPLNHSILFCIVAEFQMLPPYWAMAEVENANMLLLFSYHRWPCCTHQVYGAVNAKWIRQDYFSSFATVATYKDHRWWCWN